MGGTEEVASVNRVFQDPLLGRKNYEGQYWKDGELNPERLLDHAGVWSSGERHLALLAAELWGYTFPAGAQRFSILDAAVNLTRAHMVTVLDAIALRSGQAITVV